MKLWLLEPLPEFKIYDYKPRPLKSFRMVVRAKNENDARDLAAKSGDEGGDAWLNDSFSSCVPLLSSGVAEVIIRNTKDK